MAPKSGKVGKKTGTSNVIPRPFRLCPDELAPFVGHLSKNHIYITHVDSHPPAFKRKIFMVPVVMNVIIILGFIWWGFYVQGPWYFKLLASFSGVKNETTIVAKDESWTMLARVTIVRGLWFLLDLALFIFVWPYPVEFFFGWGSADKAANTVAKTHPASPVKWRIAVGFREQEVIVRKSRNWDRQLLHTSNKGTAKGGNRLDFLRPEGDGAVARAELLNVLRASTRPELVQGKTGYLAMDAQWDLSFAAMIVAHAYIDQKVIVTKQFALNAFVWHEIHGWLVVDLEGTGVGGDRLVEERRRDVFQFREALAAIGKEDLFYRWIEVVQFESTRPGGFGKERQTAVAQQIRDMFSKEGINFDDFWKEAVGKESSGGV